MIRVGVVGGAGRMGREVCRTVEEAPDLALAAIVDPAVEGRSLPDDWMPGVGSTALVSSSVEGLADAGVDVAVDFTVADAARRTLPWLAEHGVHAVVGTTGLGPEDLVSLGRVFSEGRANAVVSPNFAIGAVLLMRFCELAAPFMDGAEVIELHHDAKRDAPSGTALRTAERIAAARQDAGASAFRDHTTELALDGARGGSGPGGVRVHSVRLPGLVAHEEVIFGAPGQSLVVRHDSYDRRSFMPGVLLAIRRVGDLPGVTLGLDALLGI